MRAFVKRIKAVNAAKGYDPPYLALIFKVLAAYDSTPRKYKDYLKVRTLTDVFWSILFGAHTQAKGVSEESGGAGAPAADLDILALSYFKEVMSLELFYPLRNSYLEECIGNLKENRAIARTIYLMKLMLDTYKKKGDLTEVMNAMNSDFNPKILDYLASNIVFIASDGRAKGGKASAGVPPAVATQNAISDGEGNNNNNNTEKATAATTATIATATDNEEDKKEHLVHIFNLVSYLFCYSRGTCFTLKQTEQIVAAAGHSQLLREVFLSWFLENALTPENIKFCVGNLRFDDDNPSNGGKFTPKAFHFLLGSLSPELLSLSNTDPVIAGRNLSIFYRLFLLVNGLKKLLKRGPQQTNSNEDFFNSFHATTSFDLL